MTRLSDRRKWVLTGVIVLALLSVLVGAYLLQSSLAGEGGSQLSYCIGDVEVVVNCSMPTVSTTIPNLKIVNIAKTEDEAAQIVRDVFGFTGTAYRQEMDNAWRIVDRPLRDVYLSDTGFISYSFGSGPPPFKAVLPSDTEAKIIADPIVERLKACPLMPQHPKIAIVFNDIIESMWSSSSSQTTWVDQIKVRFTVLYDGVPIGKIGVELGHYGMIVGAGANWRDVEEAGMIRIITPEQALQRIPEYGFGRYRLDEVDQLVLDEFTFLYYEEDPRSGSAEYLTPMYELKGTMLDVNGEEKSLL